MPRYRVAVEFDAVDDDNARELVHVLTQHEETEHNNAFEPVADSLAVESTYWKSVAPTTS